MTVSISIINTAANLALVLVELYLDLQAGTTISSSRNMLQTVHLAVSIADDLLVVNIKLAS